MGPWRHVKEFGLCTKRKEILVQEKERIFWGFRKFFLEEEVSPGCHCYLCCVNCHHSSRLPSLYICMLFMASISLHVCALHDFHLYMGVCVLTYTNLSVRTQDIIWIVVYQHVNFFLGHSKRKKNA